MTREDWADYVHTALDPLCNCTITFSSGLVRVDAFVEGTPEVASFYEVARVDCNQTNADECIASVKADLGIP